MLSYFCGVNDFYARLTPDSCRIVYIAASCSVNFGIIMCSVVLILRTYAIWGKNIYVLIYLSSFQFVSVLVIIFALRQSAESTTCTLGLGPLERLPFDFAHHLFTNDIILL